MQKQESIYPNSTDVATVKVNCPQIDFNNPYVDGYAKAIWEQEHGNKTDWKPQRPKPKSKPLNKPKRAFIPAEVFNRTRAGYEHNVFIQNLLTRVAFPFDVQDIEKSYFIVSFRHEYKTATVREQIPFLSLMLRAT